MTDGPQDNIQQLSVIFRATKNLSYKKKKYSYTDLIIILFQKEKSSYEHNINIRIP